LSGTKKKKRKKKTENKRPEARPRPAANAKLLELAKKKRQIYLLTKLQENKPLSAQELKELAAIEKGTIDVPLGCVSSQGDIASVFNVRLRTIQRWVADGMPIREDGYYSVLDIERWRAQTQKGTQINKEKEDWETKIKKQKAQLQEIELKKALGEYVPLADVEKGRVERVIMVKRALFQLPKLCAQRCQGMKPQEIEAIVREYVEDICNKFAQ